MKTFENSIPTPHPIREPIPPKIAAKIATITPKMAPNMPRITPKMAAPTPIKAPPTGITISKMRGRNKINKSTFILSSYTTVLT